MHLARTGGPRRDLQARTDAELMQRVSERDAQAFEVIFDRYANVAFSLAYRICSNRRHHAEEVVQDAFLSIWRHAAGYDPDRGSVRTWILGTVHNRAIDTLRRNRVRTGQDISDDGISELLISPDRTEIFAQRHEDANAIRMALAELPETQRAIVELAYFGGLSHTEIAERLELPVGTVKGRMRLALTKLRSSLDRALFAVAA